MVDEVKISKEKLTEWADSLIHMNHHATLVQREIAAGNIERASHLSERARKRAWKMLNELFECGAEKPEGYCEPDKKATHQSSGAG
jgi:transposase